MNLTRKEIFPKMQKNIIEIWQFQTGIQPPVFNDLTSCLPVLASFEIHSLFWVK